MTDWQTPAVVLTVIAAAIWLVWTLVPGRKAAAGCGSGCSSCPAASAEKTATPGGFVGLEVLQASLPAEDKPRDPALTVRR